MANNNDNEGHLEHLAAVERALKQGRHDVAAQHLQTAAKHGADHGHVAREGARIKAAKAAHDRRVKASVRWGFFIALIGYLIVSSRQPLGWKIPVWTILIFLVIPGLVGLFVGLRHRGERAMDKAFWDGLRSVLWAMAIYATMNIVILAGHLGKDSTQMAGEDMAAFVTVVVFSVAAGAVAGIVSAIASRGKERPQAI